MSASYRNETSRPAPLGLSPVECRRIMAERARARENARIQRAIKRGE